MNKAAIKNFAIWARNKLIADISYRAGLMGITAEGIKKALPMSTGTTEFYDIGTVEPFSISGDAVKQRRSLVEKIRSKERETNYLTAYKYVIEEVAYTWFNRLIAIRFMEVNDYLPSHLRVLSSDSGKIEPDLVTSPFDAELPFTSAEEQEIYRLKQENKVDEVFRMLFIKQCNALNDNLPILFEKTSDYTELLLNLSVIDQDGVVWHLVHDIPEEDFNIQLGGQVEIIGWLYQYYNTEPKNEAFSKNGKITKEEIPAVTQLFTPDWIVRYMVENSVGRLWIEHLRALDESKDEAELAAEFGWKYYLPEAKQEPQVEESLRELRRERLFLNPEQITLIDPCMGSGHILVYGFSVLMQIYESAGYGQRDAARNILKYNLFGLDIDDRAYQMAYFAIMMKAREYNRRILNGEYTCKVYSIKESNGITDASLNGMGDILPEDERRIALQEIKELIAEFKDAKEYGSILNVKRRDWDLLRRFAVPNEEQGQLTLDIDGSKIAAQRLQEIIDIAETMTNQYMITVTNPPYMGSNGMDPKLSNYVKKNYPDSKSDLFAVFIEQCGKMTCKNGFQSMITQHAWMFLSSFKKLRAKILHKDTVNMVHLGARAFEEISGEVVQTTSFVMHNNNIDAYAGTYCRLIEPTTQQGKEEMFLKGENRYTAAQCEFEKIPGSPVAYWFSDDLFRAFENTKLLAYAQPKVGLQTGNNELYLRLWHEVSICRIKCDAHDSEDAMESGLRWFPCNKGGEFRRWYGNNNYIVDWEQDGIRIRNQTGSYIRNPSFYFKEGMTWSTISSGKISMRYSPVGFMFETKGSVCFVKDNQYFYYVLGMLNTNVAQLALGVLSPTLDYHEGPLSKIPMILDENRLDIVSSMVKNNVMFSRTDWDSYETSWDFKRHPLVEICRKWQSTSLATEDSCSAQSPLPLSPVQRGCTTLDKAYTAWQRECNSQFALLKENEEELNRIFIDIYGLQDELTPDVEMKDVTVHYIADTKEDAPDGMKSSNYLLIKADVIKSLLSYAVGCMFGRYSLDVSGLAYAGGAWDNSKYSSFLPDEDNVIPITDEEYLEDDIVSRLCKWLKIVFGESTLEQNLHYIAEALGNEGDSSREVIRNYFLNDFFKDHCQTYSVNGSGKRPIYWLFDSGKQNGFKALIYLHRYNADTIGNLRIDYLHRMQRVYESEISRMQDMVDNSTSDPEVAQATKRREKLQKQLKECREYDERLAHLALSRIELDLDDGVKVNYRKLQTANDGKFYEVLADSKKIMAKK